MGQLGSFLPEEYRKNLANENFKDGAVFKCYHPIAQKDKRFILVAHRYDKIQVATIFINSDINPNKFPSQKLKDLHLYFAVADRNYLEHDSFADCSQLIPFSAKDLFQKLIEDPTIHLGVLSEADHKLVRETIKKAFTIRPSQKKEFGLFF